MRPTAAGCLLKPPPTHPEAEPVRQRKVARLAHVEAVAETRVEGTRQRDDELAGLLEEAEDGDALGTRLRGRDHVRDAVQRIRVAAGSLDVSPQGALHFRRCRMGCTTPGVGVYTKRGLSSKGHSEIEAGDSPDWPGTPYHVLPAPWCR